MPHRHRPAPPRSRTAPVPRTDDTRAFRLKNLAFAVLLLGLMASGVLAQPTPIPATPPANAHNV